MFIGHASSQRPIAFAASYWHLSFCLDYSPAIGYCMANRKDEYVELLSSDSLGSEPNDAELASGSTVGALSTFIAV